MNAAQQEGIRRASHDAHGMIIKRQRSALCHSLGPRLSRWFVAVVLQKTNES